MKTLKGLTKKERNAYMSASGFSFNTKHGYDDAFVQYLFENNSIDEVKNWFKNKAATVSFDCSDLISVYAYNRIFEKLN